MEHDIYVVTAERDTYENRDDSRPIAWETPIDSATYESAVNFANKLGGRYGETRIAKLVFVDDPIHELIRQCDEIKTWFGKLEDWSGVGDPPIDAFSDAIRKVKKDNGISQEAGQ